MQTSVVQNNELERLAWHEWNLIYWLMHKEYQVMLAKLDVLLLSLADIQPTPHAN